GDRADRQRPRAAGGAGPGIHPEVERGTDDAGPPRRGYEAGREGSGAQGRARRARALRRVHAQRAGSRGRGEGPGAMNVKERLRSIVERIDAATLRERVIIFLALTLALV